MTYSVDLSCLILLFVLLLPYLSMANITLGSSLSTTNESSSWLSPAGDFAFGFQQINNSNLFLLAIWFNKIPDRTVVWHANGDNNYPVGPVARGSSLELTSAGLELKDPRGNTIWDAKPAARVSDAAMLDTGNFVLKDNNSNSSYAWESYKSPTDTILPTQSLDSGSSLFSKLTETNFSRGRFQLQFLDGNLQLNPVAWPTQYAYEAYYSSDTQNVSGSGSQLVFNESAYIYIQKNNGDIVQLPNWGPIRLAGAEPYYFRATLDFDGVLRQYAYEKDSDTNRSWRSFVHIPENICEKIFNDVGSGACGFNSYCQLDQNGKPICECPPDYVLVDPNNIFLGCKPNFRQSCEPDDDGFRDPEELFEIRELNISLNWPLGDYERLGPYSQSNCAKSCLHDCNCAVIIFDRTGCWKKKLPLSNGRTTDDGYTRVGFKVRKGDASTGFADKSGTRNKEGSILLGVFLLGGFAIFNLLLLVVIFLFVFVRHKRRDGDNNLQQSSHSETNLRCFTYQELNAATDGFKEELGRGSFGIVYKGVLKTASRNVAIAVKNLDKLAQEREQEFRTEVDAIGKTHHKNLVQLLGFCDQGVNRLLVYEFMSNGTLANFLFSFPRVDWNLRVRVSLEIARGLVYLHEECNVPIIHCDIKPQNILLDEYFVAKISDFGLSKLLPSDQSRTRTVIRGTRGYVAPEWFKNVAVSAKVDVYSYGVMLLEIICCRRSVETELEEEEKAILTDWAYDCYGEGRLDVLVNEEKDAMVDKCRLYKWLMIAIWCVQENPSTRPTMKMVLHMLEGYLEVPEPPRPSSFNRQV